MNNDSGGICLLGMAITGLPPMLILLTSLVPDYVERTRAMVRDRPGRSFLLGLVNFIFFGAWILLIEVGFPPVAFLGILSLVIILPLCILLGLLVAAGVAGERIWFQVTSRPGSLLGSLVLGILALGMTLLVPIFGWLLFLALTLTGLGAAILTLVRCRKAEPKHSPLNTEEPVALD